MRWQMTSRPKHNAIDFELVDFSAVETCVATVFQHVPQKCWSSIERDSVEIALTEILNNIVEHGGHTARSAPVRISWNLSAVLEFEILDYGKAFPADECPQGAMPDPMNLPEGGFGWGLIHLLTDDLWYERVNQKNILRFTFKAHEK